MVAYMDKLIGRIVDKTVQLGIAERTLILVTGDNGTHRSLKSNMGDTVIVGGGNGDFVFRDPNPAGIVIALEAGGGAVFRGDAVPALAA